MRFGVCPPFGVFGGTVRIFSIVAALMLGSALTAVTGAAGDLSPQPADSLSITNSSTRLLPQTQAPEESWLSGLHMSGYLSQTFGMWQNPHNTHEWTASSNTLAVSRTLLQVDENYRLNESNTFFAREWFVYEPPYSYNSANNLTDASVQNAYLSPYCTGPGITASPTPSQTRCFTQREHAPAIGHTQNDFYNNYQVRDVWWENKWGPLTTFVGNQIVVWGQSLAFRVGDVINPQDLVWNFGFANLEQSRNAQWMIHPILNLPEWGPLQSNFLELVVQPGFQPQWWENDYYDNRFGGPGGDVKDGRVATYGTHSLSMRFDVAYDNRHSWDKNIVAASGPGPYFGFAAQFAYNATSSGKFANLQGGFYKRCNTTLAPSAGSATPCWGGGSLIGAPLMHTFWECFGGGQLLGVSKPNAPKLFDPLPAKLRSPTGCAPGTGNFGGFGNNLLLSHANNPLGAAGDFALWNFGVYHIPGMQPENWNDGARLHTLVGSTELTALYYNDNMDGGFPTPRFVEPYYTNLGSLFFADIQEVGITADRPMPIPASLGEYLPVVGRAEAIYVNHQPFMDARPLAFSGVRYSDLVKWMVALDIDQAYAPWLTSTGNLTAFFEVYDQITMDNSKLTPVGPLLSEHNLKNQVFALASIGTGWFWEDVEPTWTMIFQPKGRTFALFPTLVLNPPWTKKYFVKFQAIEVMGGDRGQGLGLFKGQSLLTAQLQYNFNLL